MFLLYGFLWYLVIAHVGVSAGLHRYFAHRAFKAHWLYEVLVLWLTNLIWLRSPIGWIGVHRMHHHHSDTDLDPHSPKYKGLANVIFGVWKVKQIPTKYAKDLYSNPFILFFHKYWALIWGIQAIIALAISWKVLVAYTLLPSALALIGFGLVNGLCHVGGKSRNLPIINLLTAGEGYHDEHHNGMNFRFHKYDHTGAFLEWLSKGGLIERTKI